MGARKGLARVEEIHSVLFVCYGNICRSPYAEGAFRKLAEREAIGPVRVASAGLIGPGRNAPPEAVRAAATRGVDLSHHRSHLVTPELLGAADLVVVMDVAQETELRRRLGWRRGAALVLGDLDPQTVSRRRILDPVDQPVSVFDATYARIDRCVGALVGLVCGDTR
jgi:protein-tyrosine phosphatase